MQSDYMHWAKFKPAVRYQLTGSEVPHFRMDSLPIAIADLDLDGASHPRYPPLREAIAGRYGVGPERVVAPTHGRHPAQDHQQVVEQGAHVVLVARRGVAQLVGAHRAHHLATDPDRPGEQRAGIVGGR